MQKVLQQQKTKQFAIKNWDNEIKLEIDEFGRVYDEAGRYIADAEYQESSEY